MSDDTPNKIGLQWTGYTGEANARDANVTDQATFALMSMYWRGLACCGHRWQSQSSDGGQGSNL
jgi:hypothetical protein